MNKNEYVHNYIVNQNESLASMYCISSTMSEVIGVNPVFIQHIGSNNCMWNHKIG